MTSLKNEEHEKRFFVWKYENFQQIVRFWNFENVWHFEKYENLENFGNFDNKRKFWKKKWIFSEEMKIWKFWKLSEFWNFGKYKIQSPPSQYFTGIQPPTVLPSEISIRIHSGATALLLPLVYAQQAGIPIQHDGHIRYTLEPLPPKLHGRNADWGPQTIMNAIAISTMVKSRHSVHDICVYAHRIHNPGTTSGDITLPSAEYIRCQAIKFDLMCSQWQRMLLQKRCNPEAPTHRIDRWLVPDSSPQAGFDYFACTMETLERPLPIVAVPNGLDLTGIEWRRRSLPLTVFGLGESKSHKKLSNIVHMAVVEAGHTLFKSVWRHQVRGIGSDDGVEKKLRTAPMAVGTGSLQEVAATIQELRSGQTTFNDPEARDRFLFPKALDISTVMHIWFNALQRAIEADDEWETYETQLKGCCKVLGTRGTKERFLETGLKNANTYVRLQVTSFHGSWVGTQTR